MAISSNETPNSQIAPRRLYLDNAATSFPKPPAVLQAMVRYATEIGASAGRGGYAEAMAAASLVSECRQRLNQLFNGQGPERFIFTLNCTDALNLAIKGLIDPAKTGHAICSSIDHNSVLRPLGTLAAAGAIEVTRLPIDCKTGLIDPDDLRRAVRPDTRLIALTHVSNVSGTIQPLRELATIARRHGIPLVVDAAQSAGHLLIDLQADGIDLLAAPGHKALMGPLGTGFLYVRPGMEKILRPLKEGGTGSEVERDRQPEILPDKYECGSHNVPGIAGLSAGVQWVMEQTVEKLAAHDRDLSRAFIDGLEAQDAVTYIGPQGIKDRIGVFSVRLQGVAPMEAANLLETRFGILVRSGLHCAIHAHRAFGTAPAGGSTRLSFGPFLTPQDVSFAADALCDIAAKKENARR